MALLWMDGFDHYGGSTGNMLSGVWAEIAGGLGAPVLSSSNPRTGSRHISYNADTPTADRFCRRVLGVGASRVGIGFAYYMSNLPVVNGALSVCDFRDVSNNINACLIVNSTGSLTVRTKRPGESGGVNLATTATPALNAESYNHIEMACTFGGTGASSVEVRVNGVTVISLVDTNLSSNQCHQMAIGLDNGLFTPGNPAVAAVYYDDLFVWDDTGTTNNDFLGDRRVRTIYPDSDTAVAEWSVTGAASGFAAINQTSPDGDTTYIEADTNVPVTSEFGLQDLPASTGAIAAVQTYIMQRKTEAGDGSTQTSLISGSSVADGADRPITEIYTYWMDVFETDPATGSAWTKAGVDAAKLRLKRTL